MVHSRHALSSWWNRQAVAVQQPPPRQQHHQLSSLHLLHPSTEKNSKGDVALHCVWFLIATKKAFESCIVHSLLPTKKSSLRCPQHPDELTLPSSTQSSTAKPRAITGTADRHQRLGAESSKDTAPSSALSCPRNFIAGDILLKQLTVGSGSYLGGLLLD